MTGMSGMIWTWNRRGVRARRPARATSRREPEWRGCGLGQAHGRHGALLESGRIDQLMSEAPECRKMVRQGDGERGSTPSCRRRLASLPNSIQAQEHGRRLALRHDQEGSGDRYLPVRNPSRFTAVEKKRWVPDPVRDDERGGGKGLVTGTHLSPAGPPSHDRPRAQVPPDQASCWRLIVQDAS